MKNTEKEVGGVQLPEGSPSWLIQLSGSVQSIPREEFSRHINSFTALLAKRWQESAINEARRLVDAYDLTPQDVFSRSAGAKTVRSSQNAKYIDIQSGNTWSGRGRRPAWLIGKDPAQFLVMA